MCSGNPVEQPSQGIYRQSLQWDGFQCASIAAPVVANTVNESESVDVTPTPAETHSGSPSRKAWQLQVVRTTTATITTKFGNAPCAAVGSVFEIFLFIFVGCL